VDSDHTGERAGPTPFGPFLLERRLAVGGSAEVFLARPKRGERPAPRFVVKRLLPSNQKDNSSECWGAKRSCTVPWSTRTW